MSLKNWGFAFGFVLIQALVLPAMADETESVRRIVVLGNGEASAAPDKAVITLGARHSAKNAADALAQTSLAVKAILSRIEAMGVASKDIQTSTLSLNPIWRDRSRDQDGVMLPPDGFEAYNSVRVTLRDLDRLGEVLDQVARDGANSFSGFRFGLIDGQPLLDDARKGAIEEGRRKARLYAAAAGVTLGELLLITEDMDSGGNYPAPMMEMSARSSSVPIAQGEVSRHANVKMIFSIAD